MLSVRFQVVGYLWFPSHIKSEKIPWHPTLQEKLFQEWSVAIVFGSLVC
jgi:hypothetical protein